MHANCIYTGAGIAKHQRVVALTFDNSGAAKNIGQGAPPHPDPGSADITLGTPRLLRLLDELGARGTFFIEGRSILHHRGLVEQILEAGHQVGLHGWHHEVWTSVDAWNQERILVDGRELLTQLGVVRPAFRAPGGGSTSTTSRLLAELDYSCESVLIESRDLPAQPRQRDDGVWEVPYRWEWADYWLTEYREPALARDQIPRIWSEEFGKLAEDEVMTIIVDSFRSAADMDLAPIERWLNDRAAEGAAMLNIDQLIGGQSQTIEVVDWRGYLRRRGIVDADRDVDVVSMSTGVSGDVVRVGDLVCKQPAARLRVATRWEADRERVVAEAAAVQYFDRIAPPFVALDPDRFVLVERFVDGETWKHDLMRGLVDVDVAARAGAALKEIHSAPADTLDVGTGGIERFRQLRIEPYFERAMAQRPELAAAIAGVIGILEARRDTIVHGDYSPKNLLVTYEGTRPTLTVIDWEVVHAGHPLFDVAFLLAHLRAKALQLPPWRDRFERAELAFLGAYGDVDRDELDPILGAILVARVDGRSPLEYLDERSRNAVRDLGTTLLCQTSR